MSETAERLAKFVEYAKSLDGDEKGEAQVFCDRLFIAFGHDGYKEAGATLEFRPLTIGFMLFQTGRDMLFSAILINSGFMILINRSMNRSVL